MQNENTPAGVVGILIEEQTELTLADLSGACSTANCELHHARQLKPSPFPGFSYSAAGACRYLVTENHSRREGAHDGTRFS